MLNNSVKKIIASLLTGFMAANFSAVSFAESSDVGAEHEIFVATDGNDENKGTKDSPFKTVKRAQQEVRRFNKDMKGDIIVYLREGVYRIDETLLFEKEDSGSNGYDVVYKSYDGEQAEISGGKKLDNFVKGKNGIWYTDVDGVEYAQSLYVNDRRARRAQTEKLIDVDKLYKLPGSDKFADGILVYDKKYADYKNPQDIQLHFARGWKDKLLNVMSVSKASNGTRFLMRPASFEYTVGEKHHSVSENHSFYIENAFEELDTPGEFYYDRAEKRLYYMPRSDEDMNNAEVELPVLETLIDIKGDYQSEKVKNIHFDSLKLAHATWNRASMYGHAGDQAQTMFGEPGEVNTEPGHGVVPANIKIDRAEKIKFTNNEIFDMGAVGIGLYYGVDNCTFEANAFYDIFDGAMTVGLPEQVYEENDFIGTNIANQKPTTASSVYSDYFDPHCIVDGNPKKIWSPSGAGPHWVQVDLLESSRIDRIEMDDRMDPSPSSPDMRAGIEFWGSDDPEFKTYEVMGKIESPFELHGTGVVNVKPGTKYRYVRAVKPVGYFVVSELRIIDESIDHKIANEICRYNNIKNNSITRIGIRNYGAPGIQVYYSEAINISHNHIHTVPYSGIAVGWNWDVFPDSTVCRDNHVDYNLLENHMQVAFDGGGIYILGNQPNSTKIGNYVREQPNNLSAFYLDSGSRYYTMRENVCELAPIPFFSAVLSSDNLWQDNWSCMTHDKIMKNKNCFVSNNKIFIPGNPNIEAAEIMRNAGIEDEYKYVDEKAGKNWWPYPEELITNNAKKEIVEGLMSDTQFMKQYLANYIYAAKTWLQMMVVGDDAGEYPQSAKDRFEKAVLQAEKLTMRSDCTRDEILDTRKVFLSEIKILEESVNSYSTDELVALCENELENCVIGEEEGMNFRADYDRTQKALSDVKNKPYNKYAVQYLEKCYLNLRDNKIRCDIREISMPDQMGEALIDEETRTITVPVKYRLDVTSVKPEFIKADNVLDITPDVNTAMDFTDGVVYTVSTKSGKSKKDWTVKLTKPEPVNSEAPINLKDAIAQKDKWNLFNNENASNYSGEIYGDVELDFDMEICSEEYSYPGFMFRNQDPNKSYGADDNETYIIIFTPGEIEFHRFNDGVRTQFYGPVKGCTTIFGETIKSDAFRLGKGNKNRMQVETRNVEDGVHIKITINGETVIDFVDNYPGAIKNAGYVGTIAPGAPVILSAE